MKDMRPFFRSAKVVNHARSVDEKEGTATILVAAFGVPDTGVAHGNTARQVIDKGAFRNWVGKTFGSSSEGTARHRKMFVDHGDALTKGVHSARLQTGVVDSAEETEDGLLIKTRYNLETQVGREAFSNLIFDPDGAQFSFGWDDTKTKTARGDDGYEHVTEIWPIEFSQVAFGAQALAHLVAARAAARAAGDKVEGTSLEAVPMEVRSHFVRQYQAFKERLGGYPYVEEVFDNFVIVSVHDQGRTMAYQVKWSRAEDGETIEFDLGDDAVTEVESQWVKARGLVVGSITSEPNRHRLADALVEDPAFAREMRAGAEAALADDEAGEGTGAAQEDVGLRQDVAAFYRMELDAEPVPEASAIS